MRTLRKDSVAFTAAHMHGAQLPYKR